MAEVIGLVSGVITFIDTSIKVYDSAQKDIKLSETFQVVRCRLPVILQILATYKSNLTPQQDSIPEDVCEALAETLYACRTKTKNLEEIFQDIMCGPSDARHKRYLKALRRLGKGNKVEELMLGLTEYVQLIVNHQAVISVDQEQNAMLGEIINEMKSVASSVPDKETCTETFNSGGGPQTNNVNSGSGKQYVSNGSGNQYNAENQTFGTD